MEVSFYKLLMARWVRSISMINGIIIVDKEPGYTSHDVVAKLRGICGQKKIGHTGTLDPQATGVLPVCLGSAAKLCDMLTDRDKEYVAELLLGVETDTQDTAGQVLNRKTVEVSDREVRNTCESFLGRYDQVPPMYSALKVNGRKLCDLAREGKEVERKPRTVTIYELEILECKLPVVKMRVECSKGTYIRTLCADIGMALGCGGTMQSLRRTRAGEFAIREAFTLGQLQQLKDQGRLLEVIRPVDSVFEDSPLLHIGSEFSRLLENGNAIEPTQTAEGEVYASGKWVRFYRQDDSFAGSYAYDQEKKQYRPVKMFLDR